VQTVRMGTAGPAGARAEQLTLSTGRLCLDFVATVADWRHQSGDLLTGPGQLDEWLRTAGLPVPVAGSAAADLDTARALRSAVNGVARALLASAAPAADDIRQINACARKATPVYFMRADGRSRVPVEEPDASAALAVIARDAVHLLTGPDLARLRECACDDCTTLFFDRSPSGGRRWCSMQRCGGRVASASDRRRRSATARRPAARPVTR
jgi:predicted RNA-binding Zn ribbon-like protein